MPQEPAGRLILICALVGAASCDGKGPVAPRDGSLLRRQVSQSSSLTATALSSSEISLAWADVAGEAGYEIHRSPGTNGQYTLLVSLGASATAYTDGALTPTTVYCYKIRSFRITGRKQTYTAFSDAACAATKLEQPRFVQATPESSAAVAIAWTAGAGTASGFQVERSARSAGPWEIVATTDATARIAHDSGRASEQQVCYHVIGLGASGDSAPSAAACTTPPARPTNLAAVAVSNAVALTWEDHSAVEESYQVQRTIDGATFSTVSNLAPNSVSYRDAAVVVGTTYSYRVTATKDGGRSDFSNVVPVTIPSPQADPPLNAPSEVSAAAVGSTSMRLSWTDNTANEDGFRLEQATSVNGPWTLSGTTPANVTSLTLTEPAEQQLCFHVVAFNANGNSPASTADCSATLASPTNLVATAASDGVDLSWSDNSSLEYAYVVEFSADGSTFSVLERLDYNTTTFHHTGVRTTSTYWYRVRATRDGGTSDFSNTAVSAGACVPTSEAEVCDNGVDDNCDGYADAADPICDQLVDCNANPCGSGTICDGHYCVSSCSDGFRDSDESDVDCGGGCGHCQIDQMCWGSYDCASNNCVYAPGAFMGVCKPAVGASVRMLKPAASAQRGSITRPRAPTRRRP